MNFLTNPCGPKGRCLVKACCRLIKKSKWDKEIQCPEYKIYHDRKEKIENLWYRITEFSFISFSILTFLWIVITFILGMIKEWEYIKRFINFLF